MKRKKILLTNKGFTMKNLQKHGHYKNILSMMVVLSMILSLMTGFSLNETRVKAASNPLAGKKIVAMDSSDYTGALTDAGDLYVWGAHTESMGFDAGQPNKILGDIKKFELGYCSNLDPSFALSNNGILYRWNYDSKPKIMLNNIRDMGTLGVGQSACTYYAVSNDNALYTFGDESYLGRKADEEYIFDNDATIILSDVKHVFRQKYPSEFCGATTGSGNLYIWGESQINPVKIASEVKTVQMGRDGSICLLKENGILYTGTLDENMVLNVNEVTSVSGVLEIFLDYQNCYALTEKGEVYIIDLKTSQLVKPAPILTNVNKMFFSGYVFAAISKSNDMYIWLGEFGSNTWGIMGDGTNDYNSEYVNPRKILSDVEDVSISADSRILAKKTNGDLYQWGRDSYGGMGNTIPNSYTPMKYMSNVDSIIYFEESLCGVLAKDRNFYMWGLNYFGDIVYAEDRIVYNPYCITSTSITSDNPGNTGENDPEDVPPVGSSVYSGGNETINDKFSIGEDTKFTIPSNIPLIGDGEVSLDFGNIPVQFERDGNEFKIGIGVSDLKSLKEDGWTTFKKFVETQKDEYKQGINSLLASKFGTASTGMSVKPKIKCFGYVEGTISSTAVQSKNAKMFIEIKMKASQEWQTTVVVVPVVIKFTGEVGINANMSVGLDFKNAKVKFEGDCDFTLPKVKLSAGVGISHIADISLYGSANNNIKLSSDGGITASLTGEMGVSAKLLFASYEKALLNGTLEYYSNSKKKVRYNEPVEKNDGWNVVVDDAKAEAWNSSMNSRQRNLSSNTTLQEDVYDSACPRLLKTADGTYVLSYIAAVKGRTTGNQYAAVYSVYDAATKSWSAPVVIDDDGTADFYLDSAVDGNDIYFTWSDLKNTLSGTEVDNLEIDKAASMAEIKVAKLDLSSGKITTNTVTDNTVADVMPKLYANDKDVFIGWCENPSNDLLDMSGTNVIHMGQIKDLNLSEVSSKQVSNPVRAIAVGEVNHTVQTAYIENAPRMNYVNTLTKDGKSLSMASTPDNILQVSCDAIKGNNVFLWYAQTNANGRIYMNNGSSTEVLVENTDINSSYDVLNETDRDIIVTSSTADDDSKGSEIVGYLIEDGASDSIKLMETSGHASDFSLENYEDGYMLLYTDSTADIGNESVDAKTNLCVATIRDEARSSIESVNYLSENIVPKGECATTVEIKNNSFETTDQDTSVVVYCDEEEVGRTPLGAVLPGNTDAVDVDLKLPENMAQGAVLRVKIEKGGSVLDSKDSIVGLTDIGLSVEKTGESAVVKVSNESAYAADVILNIYDKNTEGTKLATYNLGNVDTKKTIEKVYDVSDYADAGTESLMFVITTDAAELFDCNNTASLYIGEDKLKTLDHINASKSVVDYKPGDKLSLDDLSIYAVYTDDSSKKVTNYTTNADCIDMSVPGSKSLNVTYEEVGIIRNVEIPITVSKEESGIKETPLATGKPSSKTGFSGAKRKVILQKPGKVTGLKVKNKKKKKMVVSWKWKTSVAGFQIQYAQNKKFTKKKKNKMVGKWTSKKTITKLKKGKTYYVRVRAYKKSSGKKIYGKWSKIKKVKIKK